MVAAGTSLNLQMQAQFGLCTLGLSFFVVILHATSYCAEWDFRSAKDVSRDLHMSLRRLWFLSCTWVELFWEAKTHPILLHNVNTFILAVFVYHEGTEFTASLHSIGGFE